MTPLHNFHWPIYIYKTANVTNNFAWNMVTLIINLKKIPNKYISMNFATQWILCQESHGVCVPVRQSINYNFPVVLWNNININYKALFWFISLFSLIFFYCYVFLYTIEIFTNRWMSVIDITIANSHFDAIYCYNEKYTKTITIVLICARSSDFAYIAFVFVLLVLLFLYINSQPLLVFHFEHKLSWNVPFYI